MAPKFCHRVRLGREPWRADELAIESRRQTGTYGAETEGMDLDTEGGHVLLLEFTGQVALHEGGLVESCQTLVWSPTG